MVSRQTDNSSNPSKPARLYRFPRNYGLPVKWCRANIHDLSSRLSRFIPHGRL